MTTLLLKDLGEMEYLTATALQERLVEIKQKGKLPDILLLVEHPHVYTIGKSGKDSNPLYAGKIPVYRTSRGGDITYHGPGQMVAYPLLGLRSRLRKDVHRYLRNLELAVIETLRGFGIEAERNPPWTGIWTGRKKIASIGIAVRRGITYHGVALNVNTDLAYFDRIIPCGLPWAEITSIQKETGKEVPLEKVQEEFVNRFQLRFDYTYLQELCLEDIQTGSKSDSPAAPVTSASSGS